MCLYAKLKCNPQTGVYAAIMATVQLESAVGLRVHVQHSRDHVITLRFCPSGRGRKEDQVRETQSDVDTIISRGKKKKKTKQERKSADLTCILQITVDPIIYSS